MKRGLRHDTRHPVSRVPVEAPTERRPASGQPRSVSAGWLVSVAAHLAVIAAVWWLHAGPSPQHLGPSPILVNLVESPAPEPPGPPAEQPTPEVTGDSSQNIAPPAAAPETPPADTPLPEPDAVAAPAPDTSDLLSDSQLVGAISADDVTSGGGSEAGGGDGGGGCNTARILQRALQRDPMVRTAVENAGRLGKAVILWNGDWVRSGDQDGKGLSGVRQAITWELAFAPEACRNIRVQGLVLLSLADGTRFAIGADDWRWSDLLALPGLPTDR